VQLVLDNLRSALNVGSAFRTADAFAIEKLWLCGITATPPHKEILKTALGADASMDWSHSQDVVASARALKAQGYQLIGIEQTDQSIPLQAWEPAPLQRCAIIFGNEVGGISDELLPELDLCIEIPQFGTKHSINVAVCIGIVLWHYLHHQLNS
jgi:tRNA G18 (ribose-2'-O)-methylase SpoU